MHTSFLYKSAPCINAVLNPFSHLFQDQTMILFPDIHKHSCINSSLPQRQFTFFKVVKGAISNGRSKKILPLLSFGKLMAFIPLSPNPTLAPDSSLHSITATSSLVDSVPLSLEVQTSKIWAREPSHPHKMEIF